MYFFGNKGFIYLNLISKTLQIGMYIYKTLTVGDVNEKAFHPIGYICIGDIFTNFILR